MGIERRQVRAAVVLADAVQEERYLAVIFNHAVGLQEMHEIGKPAGLIALVAAPDAEHGGVVWILAVGVRLDPLVVPERHTAWVRPVGGRHPPVVFCHDVLVRAVVRRELDDRAIGESRRELQDVSHRCPTEAIQALILVADDAEVSGLLRELQEELLLDVVRILVLVHEDIADVAREQLPQVGVCEEGEDHALQMGEVHAVVVQQSLFIGEVGFSYPSQERHFGGEQALGLDEFLRDLVEVTLHSLDGSPSRFPAAQVEPTLLRADDRVEVIEDEQQLGQLVEGLEIVPEFGPVSVLRQEAVAQAVDRRNHQFREVAMVSGLLRGGGQAVPHFEGSLLGERAEDDLAGTRLSKE
jgi:hypothetical protein